MQKSPLMPDQKVEGLSNLFLVKWEVFSRLPDRELVSNDLNPRNCSAGWTHCLIL